MSHQVYRLQALNVLHPDWQKWRRLGRSQRMPHEPLDHLGWCSNCPCHDCNAPSKLFSPAHLTDSDMLKACTLVAIWRVARRNYCLSPLHIVSQYLMRHFSGIIAPSQPIWWATSIRGYLFPFCLLSWNVCFLVKWPEMEELIGYSCLVDT